MKTNSALHLTRGRLLARNMILTFFSQGLSFFLALIITPVIIRGLGNEKFGALSVFWTMQVLFSLFDLAAGPVVAKRVAQAISKNDFLDGATSFWSYTFFSGACAFAGATILCLFGPLLIEHVFKISVGLEAEAHASIYWVALNIPLLCLSACVRGVLEAHQKFGSVNVFQVLQGSLLFLSPLVILPVTNNLSAVMAGMAMSRLAIVFVFAAYLLWQFPYLRKIRTYTWNDTKSMAQFGGWQTLSRLISPNMVYVDRFLVGMVIPIADFTYYATAFELVGRLSVIGDVVGGVFYPAMVICLTTQSERVYHLFERGIKFLLFIFAAILFLITIFADEILLMWLGPEFSTHGAPVMRVLMIGVVLNTLSRMPFNFLQAADRSHWVGVSHVIQFPIFIVSMFLFTSRYGLTGAVWVTCVRMIVDFVILFAMVIRIKPEMWRLLAKVGLVVILTFILGKSMDLFVVGLWERVFFATLITLIWIGICWFGFLSSSDRQELLQMLNKKGLACL